MKAKLSLAVCLTLVVVSQTYGDGLWTSIGRYLGYGVGDGYHSGRCCGASCGAWQGQGYVPTPVYERPTPALEWRAPSPSPAPHSLQPEIRQPEMVPPSDSIPAVIPQSAGYQPLLPAPGREHYPEDVRPRHFFPPAPLTRPLSNNPALMERVKLWED